MKEKIKNFFGSDSIKVVFYGSMVSMSFIFIFWLCWYLIMGGVPVNNWIPNFPGIDYRMEISRWWDVLAGPLLGYFFYVGKKIKDKEAGGKKRKEIENEFFSVLSLFVTIMTVVCSLVFSIIFIFFHSLVTGLITVLFVLSFGDLILTFLEKLDELF